VGFLRCPSDPTVKEILKFKLEMTRMFSMSDLKLLHYYLSIEVKHDRNGFTLSQGSYVKILERADMTDYNPCKILWSRSLS
jgi:hypothetical protein